jgi:hypothetical protein
MNTPRKIFTVLLFVLICSITSFAQKNHSKELLDEARKEYLKTKNIYLEYQYSQGSTNEINGKLYIKGNNYHLTSDKMEQYFDGKKLYTVMTQEKEITISIPKNESLVNPIKILELYRTGYKFKSNGIQKGISYIQLIPIDKANKTIIEVGINVKTKAIKSIKEILDGTQISGIIVSVYQKNLKLNPSIFVFNESKYKDYYTTNLDK